MNIEYFRDYCLSLPGTTEKMPWTKHEYENMLVFCVADKWFAFVDIDKFEFCNLKCEPEISAELQEHYQGITPGWHMNKTHWISVYFDMDVPDKVIEQLIKSSYDLIVASLPRKKRENL